MGWRTTTTTEGRECFKSLVGSLRFDLLTRTKCEVSKCKLTRSLLARPDCRWVSGSVGGCVGRGRGRGLAGVESWKVYRLKMIHPFRTVACRTGPATAVSVFINYSNSILLFVGDSLRPCEKRGWGGAGGRGSSDKLSSAAECALFTSPLRNGDVIEFFGVLSVPGDIGTSIYLHNSSGQKLTKAKGSSLIKKTAAHFGSRFFGWSRKIVARTLKNSNNNKLCIFACCPENLIPFLWTHYYPLRLSAHQSFFF